MASMASITGQNTTTDTAEERSICLFNYGNTRRINVLTV